MAIANSFFSEEGFSKAVTCHGPYSFKEFLPYLNERLEDVSFQIDGLRTKEARLARSRLHVYLEKPTDLAQDEARISFTTNFTTTKGLWFSALIDPWYRFQNSFFEVGIFNRNFKKISVSFSYGFSVNAGANVYRDTLSIHASEDISPLISLMLQIMYESMLYAAVIDGYKRGFPYWRDVKLRMTQSRFEFLYPLMEERFKNAIKWINTHITPEQEAKRKQAYLDYLVRIQAPTQAWERSSRYEHRFYL